jgi:hypothetical protein
MILIHWEGDFWPTPKNSITSEKNKINKKQELSRIVSKINKTQHPEI